MTDAPPDPPDLDPASLAAGDFTRTRRGLEPAEVHATLGRAVHALRTWEARDAQLVAEIDALNHELDRARELDESRIATVLGEETARIVTAARDAAAEIRSKAALESDELRTRTEQEAVAAADALRSEATALRDEAARARDEAVAEATRVREEADVAANAQLSDAQKRRDELLAAAEAVLADRTAQADERVAELTGAAEEVLADADTAAAATRSAAAAEADAIVEQARADGREMIDEVRVARERILRDLAERRRVARRQIEGAIAGRDRIVELLQQAGADVAATVDGLGEANDAAAAAADRAAAAILADPDAELAELRDELGIDADTTATAPAVARAPASGSADEGEVEAAASSSDGEPDEAHASDPAEPSEVLAPDVDGAAVTGSAVPTADEPGTAEPGAGEVGSGSGGDPSGDGGVGEAAEGATVHDLFARIRAEETSDPDASDEADSPAAAGTAGAVAAVPSAAADPSTPDPGSAIDLTDGRAASADAAVPGDAEVSADAAVPADAAVSADAEVDHAASVLDRRDELLAPVEKGIARGLKRLASDEQNEILDRLRRVKRGRPDPAEILPTTDDDAAWVAALVPDFAGAVEAGAELWAELAGQEPAATPGRDAGREVLETRATAFLSLHRAQLQRTFADADEDGVDPSELADRFRSAYRDLRSSLSEFAGDLAIAGFAQGERCAAGPGTPWQWVVDNGGLPCADGEDNALGGATPCEEPFPTGDLMPPAHPGCRCILVPARR